MTEQNNNNHEQGSTDTGTVVNLGGRPQRYPAGGMPVDVAIKKSKASPPRRDRRPPRQRKIFETPVIRVTVSMEEAIWKRLKIIALWENRTLDSVIHEALMNLALQAERQLEAEQQLSKILREKSKKSKTRKKKTSKVM